MKRTYGHEPILLDASPVTSAQKTQKPPKRTWRKGFIFGLLLLVMMAGAIVVPAFVLKSTPRVDFPTAIVRNASFDLYRPTWLPGGWKVDQQSFDSTAEVVTFTVSDAKGKRLVITEQPKPPQPNLDTFYQQQLSGNRSLDLSAGKATLGQFEGSTLAGLATDQTWVLVRAVASVDQMDFEHVIRDFVKASR